MKNKSKKWKWFLLIIPALMILGIIRINLDEMKSKDGIYYLTVKNESTKTASLDKTSWIKIDGEQITIKEGSSEHTYSYDPENEEFTRDSEKYSCMIYDGLLLFQEISHKRNYLNMSVQIAVGIQHTKKGK